MKLPAALKTPVAKLLAAVLAFLAAVAGYLATVADSLPMAAPFVETESQFGWVADPDAVEAVRTRLTRPVSFADTEAFQTDQPGPADVYLWEACKRVTGAVLPPRDQGQVGACVGFGMASVVEHLMCVELAAGSTPRREFRAVAPEAIYAGSRVQIGQNRIRGDGSVGAWAAEFVTRYGVIPRGRYPAVDLSLYSEAMCRQLGRTGVPTSLEAVAREYPVQSIANVRTFAEARAAIRNGYPVAVCSRQGFDRTRDADGFCAARGVWYHCMALVGVRGGARPGGFLVNSWGPTAHTGPRHPADAPPEGFWVEARVLEAMLGQGDSWAASGFSGFPARTLDWYASPQSAPRPVH